MVIAEHAIDYIEEEDIEEEDIEEDIEDELYDEDDDQSLIYEFPLTNWTTISWATHIESEYTIWTKYIKYIDDNNIEICYMWTTWFINSIIGSGWTKSFYKWNGEQWNVRIH